MAKDIENILIEKGVGEPIAYDAQKIASYLYERDEPLSCIVLVCTND